MLCRMLKTELIAAAGNGNKLASILGISPQAVSAWPSVVPKLQQYRIKELKPRWFRKGGPMHAPAAQPGAATAAQAAA